MSSTSDPILVEKTAISNILRITSSLFYKYRINYKPEGISEVAKRAVLAETLDSTHKPFLYNDACVYCTKAIQYDSIDTFWERIPIRILFCFEMEDNIANDRQFLQFLVERYIKLKPSQLRTDKVIFDLNVLSGSRDAENLVCIDVRFYNVKESALCLDDCRKTARVCFDNRIYSVRSFSKEKNLVTLESSSGKVVSACPALCRAVDTTDKILFEPSKIMIPIAKLFSCKQLQLWNLNFKDHLRGKARLLPPVKVKFGNGVECVPKNGDWISAIRENEFFNPVELWSWCIVHTESDFMDAHLLVARMRNLPEDTGILIGEPLYLQIDDNIHSYNDAINSIVSKNLQIIIVFVPNSNNKPERLIKYLCCVQNSIPFLMMRGTELANSEQVHDVLVKINAILGGSPWSIDISQFKDTMFCGSDYYSPKDTTKPKVCSLVANLSDDGFSWHSHSEIIHGNILAYLCESMEDIVKKYCDINGRLPKRIVIYQRVEYHNRDVLRSFYKQHFGLTAYDNVEVIALFVRTNSETLFFRTSNGVALNVPPGTVVTDPLFTGGNDFYMTTKYSSGDVVRPTHYDIVHNRCKLASTDVLTMTYKMCHLDYALPEICDLPAPLSYARKLCVLIENLGVVPKSDLNDLLYYL